MLNLFNLIRRNCEKSCSIQNKAYILYFASFAGNNYCSNGHTRGSTEVCNGRAQVAVRSSGLTAAGQRLGLGQDRAQLQPAGRSHRVLTGSGPVFETGPGSPGRRCGRAKTGSGFLILRVVGNRCTAKVGHGAMIVTGFSGDGDRSGKGWCRF